MDLRKKASRSIAIALVGVSMITPMLNQVHANEESINSSTTQVASNMVSEQNSGEWIKLPTPKSLQNDSENYILQNSNSGEKISGVVEIINGERKELTADEAIDKLNYNEEESKIPQSRAAYKVFYKTGSQKYVGGARKITHDVRGPANITYGHSIGTTVTNQFSTSISSEQLKIQQNSGISWTKSVSLEYKSTRPVEKGKTAYVAFKPYYTQVNGQLKSFNTSGQMVGSKSAYGRSPRKTAIGCDGLEYMVYR